MNWTELVAAVENYAVQDQPTAEFTAILPVLIGQAEIRIHRELVPAAASGQNTSLMTVAGNRSIDMTAMSGQTVNGAPVKFSYPMIVEDVAALVGTSWVQFAPTSLAFIDQIWPNSAITAPPGTPFAYLNMADNRTAVIAPTPDKAYAIRVTGVWRPAPIAIANPVTWLGETHPDLLLAGVMVEVALWMRDTSSVADQPQMAVTWSQIYDTALRSALQEERFRQREGPTLEAYPPPPGPGQPPAGR